MNYERYIQRMVNSLASTYHQDPDELMSQAYEAMMRAWNKYDESSETKFEVFMYGIVRNALINWCRTQINQSSLPGEIGFEVDLPDSRSDPERICIFRQAVERLSDDAKTVLRILYSIPEEIVAASGGKGLGTNIQQKKLRGEIKRHSLKVMCHNRVYAAMREIRSAANELLG